MHVLRSLFSGLAMIAFAMIAHAPANAAVPLDPTFHVSVYHPTDAKVFGVIDVKPAHDAIVLQKRDDSSFLEAARSSTTMSPEYVASLDTHGLSFVGARYLC